MYERAGEWLIERKVAVVFMVILGLFVGCRSGGGAVPPPDRQSSQIIAPATSTAVPTATTTPSPTNTATATPSPTPTFTPTATAVPISITGDPRAASLSDPEPQNNALCGIVDTLDFPLDPPDALNVSYGGQGFGRFRSRYDQYHAGEDWQLVRGRSNLGKPVYAIGHGQVTYAQPNGWGRDKGVIIIRHTFTDGSTVLSFYGHMDPPSVTLRAGDCVVRGQKIAEIGEPRTPPHLHFEIRTHMPEEPGPGYWPTDPTEVGWLPPSQFVWEKRMAAMPGVIWTRPFNAENRQDITLVDKEALIALENGQLIGLDAADGSVRWQHTMTETVAAVMAADRTLLYAVDRQGRIVAYPLQEAEDGRPSLAAEPLWRADWAMVGILPMLLPMPDGGVAAVVWQDMIAVAADGTVLWEMEIGERPYDWLLADDQLILTTTGRQGLIFSVTTAGVQAWPAAMRGLLARVGDQIWLYADDGLYRLDPMTQQVELIYPLPSTFLGLGSIIALPDGGVLIAHREREDRRLIVFDAEGAVTWQRSYDQLVSGPAHLLLYDNQPYLLLESGGEYNQLMLYAVNWQNSSLTHIFTGGTREPLVGSSWVVSANDDLLLINVGGGSLVALDVVTAVTLINHLNP